MDGWFFVMSLHLVVEQVMLACVFLSIVKV